MKILKWFLSFFNHIIYYTIALVVAFALVLGLLAGTGYYLYNNMYLSFTSVQDKWVKYDSNIVKEIQIHTKQLNLIKKKIDNSKWNNLSRKSELLNDYNLANSYIEKLRYSMTYAEKFSSYANLNEIRQKVNILSKELQIKSNNNEIEILENELNQIKLNYNAEAIQWNAKIIKFPYNYVNKLVGFHEWTPIN